MDKYTLSELIKMAEFSYEHSKRLGAHQEFLSEDREVLSKARKYLNELSDGNIDVDTVSKLNIADVSNNEADCKYKESCGHDLCNLTECDEYEPKVSEVTVCENCRNGFWLRKDTKCLVCGKINLGDEQTDC